METDTKSKSARKREGETTTNIRRIASQDAIEHHAVRMLEWDVTALKF